MLKYNIKNRKNEEANKEGEWKRGKERKIEGIHLCVYKTMPFCYCVQIN
jgi:hypothetical protein